MTRNRGFTLIEMLIVVAILGVLAGIAVASIQKYRVRAYDAAAMSDLHQLAVVEGVFYDEYERFAEIVPADKAANGTIRKTLTIQGATAELLVRVTPALEVVANVDALGQACTLGAHHDAGSRLYAMELEQNHALLYRAFSASRVLTNADLPAATSAVDLQSGWTSAQ